MMLNKQKQAFRLYCKQHKHLYRLFSQWFERRKNRAMRDNRVQWGIDNDLVVFSSYNMRSYNDNPKYICEALHNIRPQTSLVWLFTDVAAAKAKYDIPEYVRCVEWKTPMSFLFLGCARVIVDNWQKCDWLRLGREQTYLYSPAPRPRVQARRLHEEGQAVQPHGGIPRLGGHHRLGFR